MSQAPSTLSSPQPGPFQQGLRSFKQNIYPALVFQAFAITLYLLYRFHTPTQQLLAHVSELKAQAGILFPAVSTALFGGILPFLVQRARPAHRHTVPWSALLFFALFWAYKGIEVDLLYRGQAYLFGNNAQVTTILKKLALDMGLYVPFWTIPTVLLAYQWKDRGYDTRATLASINWRWYRDEVIPLIVFNCAVWIPAVAVIYALDQPLQLPMQNLVQCFWSIMLIFLTRPSDA